MVGNYFHVTKASFKRRNTFSFSTECRQSPDAIHLFCRMQVRVFDITTSLEQLSLGFEKNLGAVNKLGRGGRGRLRDGSQSEDKVLWEDKTHVPQVHSFDLAATRLARGPLSTIAARPNSGTGHQQRVGTLQTIRLQSKHWERLKEQNEPCCKRTTMGLSLGKDML